MKYFLDTEFIETGPSDPLSLLSIGIVDETGREFYGEYKLAPVHRANAFVQKHVLPKLGKAGAEHEYLSYPMLRQNILAFIKADGRPSELPEFWAYYADYDWVIFCQIFGTMADLPIHLPHICFDIRQLQVMLGNPRLPEPDPEDHHALVDARWNYRAYMFLQSYFLEQGAKPHKAGQ